MPVKEEESNAQYLFITYIYCVSATCFDVTPSSGRPYAISFRPHAISYGYCNS